MTECFYCKKEFQPAQAVTSDEFENPCHVDCEDPYLKKEAAIRRQVKILMQRQSYTYCDTICNIAPLECASKYGNVKSCRILQDFFRRQADEDAKMHGL
jgi:hypothetical protein